MNQFEQREKAFENKFVHDQEIEFKVNARKNKLIGLWAAEKLKMDDKRAKDYAMSIVDSEVEHPDDIHIIHKIVTDFKAANISIDQDTILAELERIKMVARNQIMNS
jgi:hypothetical protein